MHRPAVCSLLANQFRNLLVATELVEPTEIRLPASCVANKLNGMSNQTLNGPLGKPVV